MKVISVSEYTVVNGSKKKVRHGLDFFQEKPQQVHWTKQ